MSALKVIVDCALSAEFVVSQVTVSDVLSDVDWHL